MSDGDWMLTLSDLVEQRKPISKRCLVYFLLNDSEVVYVGKSTTGLARVFQHLLSSKVFTHYVVQSCSRSDLDGLEKAYIRMFNPKYNLAHTTRRPTRRTITSNAAEGKKSVIVSHKYKTKISNVNWKRLGTH